MQRALLIFLSVTTLGLGSLCVVQWRQLRDQREQNRVLEGAHRLEAQTREEQQIRTGELEKRAARLQREVQEFSSVTTTLRATEATQRSNLTVVAAQATAVQPEKTAGEGKGGLFGKEMGEMVSKMMKDPEMRKMMRGQQKATLGMMYSGLFKQLRLSPDEKTRFEELLLDSQMRQVESAQGLFGTEESSDPAKDRETFQAAKKEDDAKIKALLGDERYAEFEDYQKNIGERMQLNQLQSQLEAANLPLLEQQSAQLIQIMQEEKTQLPPAIPTDPNLSPADMKALMTSENMEKQLQWTEDYNKRLLDRAREVLTLEQMDKYRDFLEQQASMQKIGLKMAKEMFGKESSPPAAK